MAFAELDVIKYGALHKKTRWRCCMNIYKSLFYSIASAMVGVPAGVWATTRLVRDKPINQGKELML